ncbi:MAG: protein kinase [Anaerolineae bacterium]|nr:protein kinase [Anaerolineae bacterium]
MMPTIPGADLQAGRYRLVECAGVGPLSSVWKAHDALLAETVAIKILESSWSEYGPDLERAWVRTKANMVRLNHPRIVRTYDFFREQHAFCIAMEYMASGSLEDRLQRPDRLELDDVLRLAAEVCDAVSAAHDMGIVHGGITPANILLDGQGRAKVADFGIAHGSWLSPHQRTAPRLELNLATVRALLGDAFMPNEIVSFCQDRAPFRPALRYFGPAFSFDDMITSLLTYCQTRLLFDLLLAEIAQANPRQYERHAGRLYADGSAMRGGFGSHAEPAEAPPVKAQPWYMAPEQVEGGASTPAVDVYALGALLYYMLTGRFHLDFEMADTTEARKHKEWLIQTETPHPVQDAPEWLAQVVMHALERDVERRYRNAAEMRAALLDRPVPAVLEQRRRLDSERKVRDYVDWGMSALNDGAAGEAIAHFQRGLALDPRNEKLKRLVEVAEDQQSQTRAASGNDRRRMVRTYISIGESSLRDQDLDSAIYYFEQALKLDPGSEPARRYLQIARHRLAEGVGGTGDGASRFELNGWLQRGEEAMRSGRYDDAIACFGRALEIDPDHYPAAELLTQARIARKRGRRYGG